MDALKSMPYERTSPRQPPTKVDRVEQKRSRRLSKPRTGSSGKAALKPNLSVGDLSLITKASFVSTTELSSPCSPIVPEEALSPIWSQQDMDARVPRFEGGTEIAMSKRERENVIAAPAKASRLHRTGTKIAKRMTVRRSFNGKTMSTVTLNDLGDQAELEIEGYEWIKKRALQDQLAMRNHNHKPGSDNAMEVMAPIRRKSLLTPGLATRGTDILRKPPTTPHRRSKTQADVQSHYYNPSLSPISPLARIASLDVPGNGSQVSVEASRACTPANLDYGLLGGLRITNGRAESPALTIARSIEPQLRRSPLLSAEVYETTSEGGWSDAETVSVPGTAVIGSILPPRIADSMTYDPYAEDVGNPWAEEADENGNQGNAILGDLESTSQLHRWPTVTSAYSQSEYESQYQSEYFTNNEDNTHRQIAPFDAQPTRPGYQSRAPNRPMSALEPTTKLNGEDAQLFDEYPPLMPTAFSQTQRECGNRSSNIPITNSRFVMSQILESMAAASRYTPLPQREDEIHAHLHTLCSSGTQRPPLSATDSGYGSENSFNSKRHSISPSSSISTGTTTSSHAKHFQTSESRDPAMISTALAPMSARSVKPPKIEISSLAGHSYAATTTSTPDLPRSKTFQPLILDISQVASTPSIETPTKERQGSPTGKKLQKRPPRPKSMPPPVDRIVISQCSEPEALVEIPSVPAHMAARNAGRWNSRPLENRSPALPVLPKQTAYANRFESNDALPPFHQPQRVNPSGITRSQPSPDGPPVPPKDQRRPKSSRSELIRRLQEPLTDRSLPASPPLPSFSVDSVASHQDSVPPPVPRHQQFRAEIRVRHKAVATDADDEDAPINWEQYRRAWAARRKSAGEALRQRPDFESITSDLSSFTEHSRGPGAQKHRRMQTEHGEGFVSRRINAFEPVKQDKSRFSKPNAITEHFRHPSACPSPLASRKQEQDNYSRAGRYNGGLAFGYEPGKGVGGSAGTRGNGATASRKIGRGDLAKGFGVDLSDVPVFISR